MTLKQLAKELNLSFSTVSKALRDSHEISAATKSRVLAKAKALNYQVNPLASSFRKQKSKTIAVIIPEVVNDFFGPVISGIESIAQQKGYHVLIYLTHEDVEREIAITQVLQNGRVDGVLISLSEQTTDTTHLDNVRQKEIPVVYFDRIVENTDAPKVTTDDYCSGFNATEHLIQHGCKRIAFLSISQNLSISHKRLKGYEDALNKNGIKVHTNLIISCERDDEKCAATIRKLLKQKNRPDAIFAAVEKLALKTYEICHELKLNIPTDVKVITFSNSYTAALLNPSLTTITQPAFEMGNEAATILFKMIEKKGYQSMKEATTLASQLIVRSSTK
ncbi:MAG: LacI family DNA-binding transcriptional regulator [Cyclobacteriaceae bacterium]|nr:LacI family DNA-binding transcriptional regulator [Cyclobacteriaceae bacterium]